jgi:hypothetical protein
VPRRSSHLDGSNQNAFLVDPIQQGGRVNLFRHRTPELYAAPQPNRVAAGLSMAAYHAVLCRMIAGLAGLGVRLLVEWPEDIATDNPARPTQTGG